MTLTKQRQWVFIGASSKVRMLCLFNLGIQVVPYFMVNEVWDIKLVMCYVRHSRESELFPKNPACYVLLRQIWSMLLLFHPVSYRIELHNRMCLMTVQSILFLLFYFLLHSLTHSHSCPAYCTPWLCILFVPCFYIWLIWCQLDKLVHGHWHRHTGIYIWHQHVCTFSNSLNPQ